MLAVIITQQYSNRSNCIGILVVLVYLLEALGFLVQLSFGSSHLALLRQQLVLQLQQFVLTLLHCCQQLLLILRGNGNIRPKKSAIADRFNFTASTVCPEIAVNTGLFLNLRKKNSISQEEVGNKYLPCSLVTKPAILDTFYPFYRRQCDGSELHQQ